MSDDDDELLGSTGHDLHFLDRLSRVDRVQTERALRLYRGPDLVRALFRDPSCPPEAARVAIAIDEGDAPPHVIVERSGAFVTCLAAGMTLGDCPAVGFDRLQIHLRRADVVSAARAEEERLFGEDGEGKALMLRLQKAGARLTREEFEPLLALEPVLRGPYRSAFFALLPLVLRSAMGVARIKRPRPSDEPLLRAFWDGLHQLGHLLVLCASAGPSFAEHLLAMQAELRGGDVFGLILRLARIGHLPLSFRVLWAFARFGKSALPSLKRALPEVEDTWEWGLVAFALATIGLRHQKLATEVQGVLGTARLPAHLREDEVTRQLSVAIREFVGNMGGADDDPETRELRRCVCAHLALKVVWGEEDEEIDFEALVKQARRITPSVLVNSAVLNRNARQHMMTLNLGVPAIATMAPADFYLPAEHAKTFAPPYSADNAVALARFIEPPGPVRAAARPGRNDPCTCGSGKKYKKCCGG